MSDTIGTRIRSARKAAGYTQDELANRLGVSYQAVSSWERDEYAPDTWNLIELAKVLEVSVSSLVENRGGYGFSTKKNLYDAGHMETFVKASIKSYRLSNSMKALEFAKEAHKGQKRKNSDVPYFYHPLNLACHMLAMDIKDDAIIAACLLHDVVEDCDVELKDLPVDNETKELVKLLTHEKDPSLSKDDDLAKYFKAISKNPKAALIKCVDRCNNLTTISWGLSRDRIYMYIDETERHVLPLIDKVIKKEVEYNNAAWLLSYQMESMLDIYKRLM